MSASVRREDPPYMQIAAAIRRQIQGGHLRDGDLVPSTRQLASQWGVSVPTAAKALRLLRSEGYVRGVVGVGTVVGTADRKEAQMGQPWKPNWVIAPAATLREWMDENSLGITVLATAAAGRDRRHEAVAVIQAVLDREPLTEDAARLLERGTFIPARFWLALEHDYRAGRAAGLPDMSE